MDAGTLLYIVVAIAGVIAWIGGERICRAVQVWKARRDPRIRARLNQAAHWTK